MNIADYRIPVEARPSFTGGRTPTFVLPKTMVEKQHEVALGIQFIANRRLFGRGYRVLHHPYFDAMPPKSGVMIKAFVPIGHLIPDASFPGDIDLLIIPFEEDELILSKTMALELKAVRAKFSRQGKSPNDFGFSQANALLALGFPYVGVAHLIVSDDSPESAWRTVLVARVIGENGEAELLHETKADMMPADLIDRCYGRLVANSPNEEIGLLAIYVGDRGCWMPRGRAAQFNSRTSLALMNAIAGYYHQNSHRFLETLTYPPDDAAK